MDNKQLESQGVHPDPASATLPPPEPANWPRRQQDAWASHQMAAFRDGLRTAPDDDLRSSVLDDLSAYHGLSPEECLRRCLHWEEWSVQEWKAEDRTTPEGLSDFYRGLQSWSFDLLWHAYLQAEGFRYPTSVAVARTLDFGAGARLLDFGSGVGVTAQLFTGLGYEVDLADVSTSLLHFASWRMKRRGLRAGYLDLNYDPLPVHEYDVITAIDTLVHVPDLAATTRDLHRALRPGGHLFANFDVRPPTEENAWHLYSDDLPLRWTLHRNGFEPVETLDGQLVHYIKVPPHGFSHGLRGMRDLITLRSPLRPAFRALRSALRPGRPGPRRG